jgi:hypothetical protein
MDQTGRKASPSKGPDQEDHRDADRHDRDLEPRAHAPIVAEAAAAGAQDQRVVLVPDRGEDGAGCRHRDQERIGLDLEPLREVERDPRRDHGGRRS